MRNSKGDIISEGYTEQINTRLNGNAILIPYACMGVFGDMTPDDYLSWADSQNAVQQTNDGNIGIIIGVVAVLLLVVVITGFVIRKKY